jgi:hypothetical protein
VIDAHEVAELPDATAPVNKNVNAINDQTVTDPAMMVMYDLWCDESTMFDDEQTQSTVHDADP